MRLHQRATSLSLPSSAIAAVIALTLASLPGCQGMRHGSRQTIEVATSPAGAQVRLESQGLTIISPGALSVRRKALGSVVRIEKEGFETQRVPLARGKAPGNWRNLVWIHPVGWIIGWIVDYSTGAAYELSPGTISVQLEPDGSSSESSP